MPFYWIAKLVQHLLPKEKQTAIDKKEEMNKE